MRTPYPRWLANSGNSAPPAPSATRPDAEFYASLIKTFDATFHPVDAAGTDEAPPGLTSEQLVPDPPQGLSSGERAAYYEADLRDAIGEEYC